MQLLRELVQLQQQRGWLSQQTLRDFSERTRVPLYRLEELVSFYPHFRRSPPKKAVLHVCRDVCCRMAGARELSAALEERLADDEEVEIHEVSCLGRCDAAPALAVNDVPYSARGMSFDRLADCVANRTGGDCDDALPDLANCGTDSDRARTWNFDPYRDGLEPYSVVRNLVQGPGDIGDVCIAELQTAGLRGMGGAGFPTGRKWELVRGEAARPKYVICNADESEPGTFKDRAILHELPHLVVEGMLLAGLTIGAEEGIVYIRHEYGPEREALEAELARARESGVLGENAAGSGRRFEIDVFVSPGGYILGEETALLEALQDKRGEPRNRPPYPGQQGLWGRPTLINNVESFAMATAIVHRGAAWWRDHGRGDCAGWKVVSVSGDVNEPGVYEIPLGTTVNELIATAGGMRDGKPLLAFLPGGASSNFLPADKAEVPLDFDAMKQAGSMLGTGAVILFAEGRDLFDLATNLVAFFRNESCGKCVPCRVGSEKAVQLLQGVQSGETPCETLQVLPELGETLEQTSICGLGQVALNPILSMLQHFPDAVPHHVP